MVSTITAMTARLTLEEGQMRQRVCRLQATHLHPGPRELGQQPFPVTSAAHICYAASATSLKASGTNRIEDCDLGVSAQVPTSPRAMTGSTTEVVAMQSLDVQQRTGNQLGSRVKFEAGSSTVQS